MDIGQGHEMTATVVGVIERVVASNQGDDTNKDPFVWLRTATERNDDGTARRRSVDVRLFGDAAGKLMDDVGSENAAGTRVRISGELAPLNKDVAAGSALNRIAKGLNAAKAPQDAQDAVADAKKAVNDAEDEVRITEFELSLRTDHADDLEFPGSDEVAGLTDAEQDGGDREPDEDLHDRLPAEHVRDRPLRARHDPAPPGGDARRWREVA